MSQESIVRTTRIMNIQPHPFADRLSIAQTHDGYPIIIKQDEYVEGDFATYIPVDTLVPLSGDFGWLAEKKEGYHRVKSKKLRGIFSMGFVTKWIPGTVLNEDVSEHFGTKKYVSPQEDPNDGLLDKAPKINVPHYDIEGWRKWGLTVFTDLDEEVVLTEKIHGANARFVWSEGRLRVGSRTQWKLPDGENSWSRAARKYGLARVCEQLGEGIVVFAELTGVQDLQYDFTASDPGLFVFDIYNSNTSCWYDFDDMVQAIGDDLKIAPILFRGRLGDVDLTAFAEGESTIAKNVREGWVIKPVKNRFSYDLSGRTILKLHGEGYLTR
jgi:RNA ligase (TIGR02306 family)